MGGWERKRNEGMEGWRDGDLTGSKYNLPKFIAAKTCSRPRAEDDNDKQECFPH